MASVSAGNPAGARRGHNLPAQVTSFVGRERERVEVARLLAGARLLTLTGPGGCGKTRLAIEVAGGLMAGEQRGGGAVYPHGAWFVDLAPLADPTLVPQAVAGALGVREAAHRPLLETLQQALADRRLLLVLDNCEHLIDACAALADTLLRACPGVRVLATSREPLRVPGEMIWRVPSLDAPPVVEGQNPPPLDRLAAYDAVRLFVERARFSQPGFALTTRNAPAVAQLCRRLDGLPLALELAAARVRALTVEALAARLDDSFRLLTAGSRTAPARQQTLRATVEWSHDLLSESERALFRRLAVFAGGFRLAAAEAVCAVGAGAGGSALGAGPACPPPTPDLRPLTPDGVLDLLAQLVDKSLVQTDPPGDRPDGAEVRYRLLETLREYGRERLEAAGEAATVRARHAAHYLALAAAAEPRLRAPDQVAWFDRLEQEHDNLRQALAWYRAAEGGSEAGLRLGAALAQFWFVRGYHGEGRAWLEGALTWGASAPARWRAKALTAAGELALWQSDPAAARSLLEEGLRLARGAGHEPQIAWSLLRYGVALGSAGERGRSGALVEESLARFRELQDTLGIADALQWLGRSARAQGDHERERALYEESLARYRQLGDRWGVMHALGTLARNAQYRADYARCAPLTEERLALCRELKDGWAECSTLHGLGDLARFRGDDARAAALYDESRLLAERVGHRGSLAWSLHGLGHVALARGALPRAAALFAESLALFRERGGDTGAAHGGGIPGCFEGLAVVALALGHPEGAARLLGAAQALHDATGIPPLPAQTADHERLLAATRAALDEAACGTEWAHGQALPLEQAVKEALAVAQAACATAATGRAGEAPPAGRQPLALTPREREVAALVARGHKNRQIAAQLVVTQRTVVSHVEHIMAKLGVHSRAQIAAWVVTQGLAEPRAGNSENGLDGG